MDADLEALDLPLHLLEWGDIEKSIPNEGLNKAIIEASIVKILWDGNHSCFFPGNNNRSNIVNPNDYQEKVVKSQQVQDTLQNNT